MARLPEALDYALARVRVAPEANLIEAFHELGITTEEAITLVREVVKATDSKQDAAGIGVYLGVLLGRGMERE